MYNRNTKEDEILDNVFKNIYNYIYIKFLWK